MKERVLKALLYIGIYICIILSTTILFFNGSFGYFVYILTLGDEKGVFLFSTIALLGALLALIPLLFHKNSSKFFYYVLVSTNTLIIFYPYLIKTLATHVFPKVI